MLLTFKGTGIVLIFWNGSFFASQSISTRVTPYPVTRHIESLRFVRGGKAAESKLIKLVI